MVLQWAIKQIILPCIRHSHWPTPSRWIESLAKYRQRMKYRTNTLTTWHLTGVRSARNKLEQFRKSWIRIDWYATDGIYTWKRSSEIINLWDFCKEKNFFLTLATMEWKSQLMIFLTSIVISMIDNFHCKFSINYIVYRISVMN